MGKINCVIVKDPFPPGARIHRKPGATCGGCFPLMGSALLQLQTISTPAHENSGDDLTESVKNIMNEAYCRDISIKTRTSLDIKAAERRFCWGLPSFTAI